LGGCSDLEEEMTEDPANLGIIPNRVYRKYAPETQAILGLKRTAIERAILEGSLPEPMPLTASGSAVGWLGSVLIEVQRKRLALAKVAAERRALSGGRVAARLQPVSRGSRGSRGSGGDG
jgi:predicted DNA-binding transcriptional regulator AlpA